MEKHIQWGILDVDSNDYYISIDKETLNKIKEWNIIKSKIVLSTNKDIKKMVQKKLFITLLTDEEKDKKLSETVLRNNTERVILKISNNLLTILIENNPEDYQVRYEKTWNKIHFLIDDSDRPLYWKSQFDETFKTCEKLNKREPTPWDIFESDYINVYNPQ